MIMLEIVIGYYPNKPEYIQAILNQLVTTERNKYPFHNKAKPLQDQEVL